MFVVEVSTNLEGTTAQAVWKRDTLDEAFMHLHQIMASAMANANVKNAFVTVLNQYGDTVKHEYWERVEEETEG